MDSKKISIINQIDQLELIQVFVEELSEAWSLSPEMTFNLNLILEEYVTNLIHYGYSDNGEHRISIEFILTEQQLRIEIVDDAGPFDLTEIPDNQDIDKPASERSIGGLGIHFIKALSDHMEYHSEEGFNKLMIIKNLPAN